MNGWKTVIEFCPPNSPAKVPSGRLGFAASSDNLKNYIICIPFPTPTPVKDPLILPVWLAVCQGECYDRSYGGNMVTF